MELEVGIVATPASWRRALQAHVRNHVAGVRLVPLQDAGEIVRSDVDVVVVDDVSDWLTPAQALALRDRGVRLVGVYDPAGRQGRGRRPLDALGVDTAQPVTDGPEALLDVLARLNPARLQQPRSSSNGSTPGQDNAGPTGSGAGSGRGTIVAVGGGSDSPGRTETAVAIADCLTARGESVVLLDLDEHDPSVARRLGYHLAPNVFDALTAAGAGRPLHSCVARRSGHAPGEVRFDVICGLANPADWAQLRDLPGLLAAAASQWRYVVVDTGPTCAPDQVPPGGARHAATRTVLRTADEVVAVCLGTRLGVLRLFDWAANAAELLDGRAMAVAVNRAPTDRFRRGELRGQLAANLPEKLLGEVTFLADDDAVISAGWDATPVRHRPGSGFVASVNELTEALAPRHEPRSARPARAARRRRRTLVGGRR